MTFGHPLSGIDRSPQVETNTHRIVARPELLAALEEVTAKIDNASGVRIFTSKKHNTLLTLLAKARGYGSQVHLDAAGQPEEMQRRVRVVRTLE